MNDIELSYEDFVQEYQRLDKEYINIRKEFLIFANRKTAAADISDAEKFRLLSSFLGDFASKTAINSSGHCYLTMDLPDHLMDLHDKIEKAFGLESKLENNSNQSRTLLDTFARQEYKKSPWNNIFPSEE